MLGASQGFLANTQVDSGAHFYVRIYSAIRWPLENLFDDSGGFGEALGRLWEALGGFGEALGRLWVTIGGIWVPHWRIWGGFGKLWVLFGKLLGGFGDALGGFGDARHPSPNNKNNYIQKCWEYANSR